MLVKSDRSSEASSLLKVDLDGNVVDKGTNQGPLFKQGFVVCASASLPFHIRMSS